MSVDPTLENIISALRHHAQVMSLPEVPIEEGVAAFEEVRAAVREYSDVIFELSGWGSPFPNDDLEDETDEHTDTGTDQMPGELERISVTGRWDFVVSDPDVWNAHVLQQLEEIGASDCVVQLNSGAQAMYTLLSHRDPFDSRAFHGLTAMSQDWGIEAVVGTPPETTGRGATGAASLATRHGGSGRFGIEYDPEVDAAMVCLGNEILPGQARRQVQVALDRGELVVDLDAEGVILGFEVIGASAMLPPEALHGAQAPPRH
ncbi:DUF2283 domain-containing protein [Streptomyces sp. NPDC055078]